jgi:hypothetical protein
MRIDRGTLHVFGKYHTQLPDHGERSPEGSRDIADGGEVAPSYSDTKNRYRSCNGSGPGQVERGKWVQHLDARRKDRANTGVVEYSEECDWEGRFLDIMSYKVFLKIKPHKFRKRTTMKRGQPALISLRPVPSFTRFRASGSF